MHKCLIHIFIAAAMRCQATKFPLHHELAHMLMGAKLQQMSSSWYFLWHSSALLSSNWQEFITTLSHWIERERMRANGGCNYLSGDEKSIKWTHHCRVSWRSGALLSIFICYLQHLCSNIVKHNHTPSWFNHTTHLHLPSFTFSLDFRTRFTCLHRCHQICYRLFYYTLARALMSCLSLTFNGFIALDVHLTGFMGLRAPRDVLKQFCVVQRLVFIAFDLKCA